MEYKVTTKDNEYIVYANDYDVLGSYIDFKIRDVFQTRSVGYFKVDDVIRIVAEKQEDECEGMKEEEDEKE